LKETEKRQTRLVKDLVEDMKDLKEELKQLKEKEKCERDVSFRWELLTRAIKGTHNSLILNYLIPTN
jgi:DNA-binding transcriptional regulator GbsR (MarR family)